MSSRADGLTLRVEATRPNLEAVVALIGEILKTPRFDMHEWKVLKQQTLTGLESARTEPASWAARQLERYQQPYQPDDPRYTATLEEDIEEVEKLEASTIQTFHKDMMSTQNSEWAIVGDTDPEALKTSIDAAVGSLTSKLPYQRLSQSVYKTEPDILVKHITDKANAMLGGQLMIAVQDTDPDYPALIAANTLLGGGFLNSRLATRIRQKEGISYGVGSTLKTSSDDPYTEWGIYAIFAPQNRERLIKALNEELYAMQKEPIDATIFQHAIQGWLESRKLARSQDDRLTVSLAEWMRLGRTGYDVQELEEKVKALTPPDVQAIIGKYLQPDHWVFSVAGSFPLADESYTQAETKPKPQ